MDWISIGKRIRAQREFLGYTREMLAEKLEVTPKFCSDIELGLKGMSVPTLCRVCEVLGMSADYILFGKNDCESDSAIEQMIRSCPGEKRKYLEEVVKIFLISFND